MTGRADAASGSDDGEQSPRRGSDSSRPSVTTLCHTQIHDAASYNSGSREAASASARDGHGSSPIQLEGPAPAPSSSRNYAAERTRRYETYEPNVTNPLRVGSQRPPLLDGHCQLDGQRQGVVQETDYGRAQLLPLLTPGADVAALSQLAGPRYAAALQQHAHDDGYNRDLLRAIREPPPRDCRDEHYPHRTTADFQVETPALFGALRNAAIPPVAATLPLIGMQSRMATSIADTAADFTRDPLRFLQQASASPAAYSAAFPPVFTAAAAGFRTEMAPAAPFSSPAIAAATAASAPSALWSALAQRLSSSSALLSSAAFSSSALLTSALNAAAAQGTQSAAAAAPVVPQPSIPHDIMFPSPTMPRQPSIFPETVSGSSQHDQRERSWRGGAASSPNGASRKGGVAALRPSPSGRPPGDVGEPSLELGDWLTRITRLPDPLSGSGYTASATVTANGSGSRRRDGGSGRGVGGSGTRGFEGGGREAEKTSDVLPWRAGSFRLSAAEDRATPERQVTGSAAGAKFMSPPRNELRATQGVAGSAVGLSAANAEVSAGGARVGASGGAGGAGGSSARGFGAGGGSEEVCRSSSKDIGIIGGGVLGQFATGTLAAAKSAAAPPAVEFAAAAAAAATASAVAAIASGSEQFGLEQLGSEEVRQPPGLAQQRLFSLGGSSLSPLLASGVWPHAGAAENRPWIRGSGPHECKVCHMRFPTLHALGGHQNGHRELRQQRQQEKAAKAAAADAGAVLRRSSSNKRAAAGAAGAGEAGGGGGAAAVAASGKGSGEKSRAKKHREHPAARQRDESTAARHDEEESSAKEASLAREEGSPKEKGSVREAGTGPKLETPQKRKQADVLQKDSPQQQKKRDHPQLKHATLQQRRESPRQQKHDSPRLQHATSPQCKHATLQQRQESPRQQNQDSPPQLKRRDSAGRGHVRPKQDSPRQQNQPDSPQHDSIRRDLQQLKRRDPAGRAHMRREQDSPQQQNQPDSPLRDSPRHDPQQLKRRDSAGREHGCGKQDSPRQQNQRDFPRHDSVQLKRRDLGGRGHVRRGQVAVECKEEESTEGAGLQADVLETTASAGDDGGSSGGGSGGSGGGAAGGGAAGGGAAGGSGGSAAAAAAAAAGLPSYPLLPVLPRLPGYPALPFTVLQQPVTVTMREATPEQVDHTHPSIGFGNRPEVQEGARGVELGSMQAPLEGARRHLGRSSMVWCETHGMYGLRDRGQEMPAGSVLESIFGRLTASSPPVGSAQGAYRDQKQQHQQPHHQHQQQLELPQQEQHERQEQQEWGREEGEDNLMSKSRNALHSELQPKRLAMDRAFVAPAGESPRSSSSKKAAGAEAAVPAGADACRGSAGAAAAVAGGGDVWRRRLTTDQAFVSHQDVAHQDASLQDAEQLSEMPLQASYEIPGVMSPPAVQAFHKEPSELCLGGEASGLSLAQETLGLSLTAKAQASQPMAGSYVGGTKWMAESAVLSQWTAGSGGIPSWTAGSTAEPKWIRPFAGSSSSALTSDFTPSQPAGAFRQMSFGSSAEPKWVRPSAGSSSSALTSDFTPSQPAGVFRQMRFGSTQGSPQSDFISSQPARAAPGPGSALLWKQGSGIGESNLGSMNPASWSQGNVGRGGAAAGDWGSKTRVEQQQQQQQEHQEEVEQQEKQQQEQQPGQQQQRQLQLQQHRWELLKQQAQEQQVPGQQRHPLMQQASQPELEVHQQQDQGTEELQQHIQQQQYIQQQLYAQQQQHRIEVKQQLWHQQEQAMPRPEMLGIPVPAEPAAYPPFMLSPREMQEFVHLGEHRAHPYADTEQMQHASTQQQQHGKGSVDMQVACPEVQEAAIGHKTEDFPGKYGSSSRDVVNEDDDEADAHIKLDLRLSL